METQEQKQSGMNAKKTNKFDFSKGKEIIKKERLEGTPFTIKWTEGKGWQLGMAEYALTDYFQEKEEVLELVCKINIDWNLLITIIGSMIDLQSRLAIEKLTEELTKKQG